MTAYPGITPDAQELANRMAITDVLHTHCRGLDRLNDETLKACYWPEAEVDYGSYKGPAQAFTELVVDALGGAYELTRHSITNTLITLQGSTARCESYVSADHLLHGANSEMCFAGRYLDRLEQREGLWKILHRQVVMDWGRSRDLIDERYNEAFTDLAKGSHDSSDPLHRFLAGGA